MTTPMRFLLAAALAVGAQAASAAEAARPNVLIIHTDEHNFRTLGCYRARMPKEQAFVWGEGVAVETPHIDALARRGAVCTRFYAASPVCTPSRASFVTGRYPQNTGCDENDKPLHDGLVSFAEALRRQGYATGYAGKWHLDGRERPGWAPARHFGFEDNRYLFNRGHWKQLEDTEEGPAVKAHNRSGEPTYSAVGADEKSFTTDFLADKAAAFIAAHRDAPFCYMVSFPDPHGPNSVRPPYDTMYTNFAFCLPASAEGRGKMEDMARYFGMVKCVDDNVGKLAEALRKAGILERTIVVFTSDHGDMCGEHGLVNKGVPYEASARIPFVVAWPGRIKAGTTVRDALSTVDFKPTLLGLLGLPPDPSDEGRDASALLLTGAAPDGWADAVFSRNHAGRWLMAVSSHHKLIVYPDSDPCLYDLDADPFEMRNRFADPACRETVRVLARQLLAHAVRAHEPYAEQPAMRADLQWCAEGEGAYAPPPRPALRPGGAKGKRARAGAGAEKEE